MVSYYLFKAFAEVGQYVTQFLLSCPCVQCAVVAQFSCVRLLSLNPSGVTIIVLVSGIRVRYFNEF